MMKFHEFKSMTEEELIEKFDESAPSTTVGINFILAELDRRHQQKINNSLKNYTIAIAVMTAIMTIFTVVNVVIFLQKG